MFMENNLNVFIAEHFTLTEDVLTIENPLYST